MLCRKATLEGDNQGAECLLPHIRDAFPTVTGTGGVTRGRGNSGLLLRDQSDRVEILLVAFLSQPAICRSRVPMNQRLTLAVTRVRRSIHSACRRRTVGPCCAADAEHQRDTGGTRPQIEPARVGEAVARDPRAPADAQRAEDTMPTVAPCNRRAIPPCPRDGDQDRLSQSRTHDEPRLAEVPPRAGLRRRCLREVRGRNRNSAEHQPIATVRVVATDVREPRDADAFAARNRPAAFDRSRRRHSSADPDRRHKSDWSKPSHAFDTPRPRRRFHQNAGSRPGRLPAFRLRSS
jgi:hypothetical protein